jgi:opacity protein-like surface antigen
MHRTTTRHSSGPSKFLILGALLLAVLIAAPASAQFSVEGFAGYYDPDSVDDNAEMFGGRIGYQPQDNWGLLLSVGVIDLEDELLDIEDDELRFGLILADLSFQWYPSDGGFYLFAGPGYADVEVEFDLPGEGNDFSESTTSWTANAGLGYRWDFNEQFFLRFEGKARYFEGDDFEADDADAYDGLDTEYTVAAGWRF